MEFTYIELITASWKITIFFNDCHNIRLNYSHYSIVRENIIEGVMTQPTRYGIRVENSINCSVEGNYVSDCVGAVHLQNAIDCMVLKNTVVGNSQGIRFYTPCMYNMVFENDFVGNSYDGMISIMPGNATFVSNMVFHNNFVNNLSPFIGIVDGEYAIDANNKDHCPLSGPYQGFEISDEADLREVSVVSNSTVYDLIFENSNRTLMLTVEGANGTIGFCRICIPHALIKPELTVIIDGGLVDVLYANYNVLDNGMHRWIYFEYGHTIHKIVIIYKFKWLSISPLTGLTTVFSFFEDYSHTKKLAV